MKTVAIDDFLKCLGSSKIIDKEKLKKIAAQAKSRNMDAKELASALIRKGKLSKWQAKYLLSGRARLNVGSYRLIDRVRRDEFGDRYLAIHEQLDRKVEIQLLPKELNQEKSQREKFLASASDASQVNHPNLVHVYDIDQEQERLYLVFEHAKGEPLDTFDPTGFSEVDAARIVRQSLDGLKAAHSHGIVHGQVEEKNLIVTPDSQVKILNLMMASLFDDSYSEKTPESDIRATGKLGLRILKSLDATNDDARSSLTKIFSTIGNANGTDADFSSLLGAWISKNEDETARTVISAGPIVKTRRSKTSPNQEKVDDESRDGTNDEPAPQISFLQRQNPVAVICAAAAACLLTLAGVAALAYSVSGTPEVANKARTNSTAKRATKSNQGTKRRTTKKTAAKSTTTNKNRKISPEELEAAKAELAKLGAAEEPAKKPVTTPVVNDTVKPTSKTPSPSNGYSSNPVTPEKSAREQPPEQPQPIAETASIPAPKTMASEPEKAKPPVDKKIDNSPKPEDLEKPFKDLPRQVDLGDITSSAPNELGKVYVPSNVLMAVELIHDKTIAKSKFVFELERSSSDRQRWFASFKKRKASPAVKIGEFFRDGNTFNFQWDASAAESDDHNYLRNCALKLIGHNDKSAFVYLRPSVKIEDFFVTAESPTKKLETGIRWLPHPDSLRIEVLPLPYTGVPKNFLYPPSRLIEGRQGVQIYFNEDVEDRFLYFHVGGEGKKSIKIQTALLFNPGNGKPIPVTPAVLNDYLARAGENAQNLAAQNTQAKNMKVADRPADMTKEDFEEAKKDLNNRAKAAESAHKLMIEYMEVVPKLYGKAIPVRVYFEMESMQIELAHSHSKD